MKVTSCATLQKEKIDLSSLKITIQRLHSDSQKPFAF